LKVLYVSCIFCTFPFNGTGMAPTALTPCCHGHVVSPKQAGARVAPGHHRYAPCTKSKGRRTGVQEEGAPQWRLWRADSRHQQRRHTAPLAAAAQSSGPSRAGPRKSSSRPPRPVWRRRRRAPGAAQLRMAALQKGTTPLPRACSRLRSCTQLCHRAGCHPSVSALLQHGGQARHMRPPWRAWGLARTHRGRAAQARDGALRRDDAENRVCTAKRVAEGGGRSRVEQRGAEQDMCCAQHAENNSEALLGARTRPRTSFTN